MWNLIFYYLFYVLNNDCIVSIKVQSYEKVDKTLWRQPRCLPFCAGSIWKLCTQGALWSYWVVPVFGHPSSKMPDLQETNSTSVISCCSRREAVAVVQFGVNIGCNSWNSSAERWEPAISPWEQCPLLLCQSLSCPAKYIPSFADTLHELEMGSVQSLMPSTAEKIKKPFPTTPFTRNICRLFRVTLILYTIIPSCLLSYPPSEVLNNDF